MTFSYAFWAKFGDPMALGVPSPFFPGILLSKKPPKTPGNSWFLKRTMVEKNGDVTLVAPSRPVP